MSKPMSPCRDCEEREPGCHDRCERYKEWYELIHIGNEGIEQRLRTADDLRALEARRRKMRGKK